MNRQLLFSLFLLLFALCGEASGNAMTFDMANDKDVEHRPFVEDGKQWTVIQADYRIYYVKTYFVQGDTVLGDYTCKKLMCKTTDYSNNTSVTDLHSCIFEENGKVYCFPRFEENTSTPIMLYNFRAMPGDTLSLGGQCENEYEVNCYQVWKELTLESGSEIFRGQLATIYDSNLNDVDEYSQLNLFEWYEVIGSVFHPFEKTYFNMYMGGPNYWLYECKVGDTLLYSNTRGIEIDDASRVTNIENKSFNVNSYYNINGQKIFQPSSKGIYIISGQKVVCK